MEYREETIKTGLIRRELHSKRFTSGIEKAVETTLKTGRETRFQIKKAFLGDRINYPKEIGIGTTRKSWVPENCKIYAAKAFEKDEGVTSSTCNGNYESALDTFMKKNKIGIVKYPRVKKEFAEFYHPIGINGYAWIDVHTHPAGTITPSDIRESRKKRIGDIFGLNELRKSSLNKGAYSNPIMIILGIQDEEKIRMMLIQESTPSPLYLKNFQEAKTNAEVFVKLNGNFPKPPQRKFHNLALATYDRSRKKVTLDNPGNLYQFAYECQAA